MHIWTGSVAVLLPFFLVILYLYHVNRGMRYVPKEIAHISPERWTREQILETARRLQKQPVDVRSHIPPVRERRYVVVGGSGLVGGFIVLHLLARGQSLESIRVVDLQRPQRRDMLDGPAADVAFFHADIGSAESVDAAFDAAWPSSVAPWPLTVYHTAAIIRPSDRAEIILPICSRVNVEGTKNVLAAAERTGASIFIATASASISLRPVNFWIPPWRRYPEGIIRMCPDPPVDEPVRHHQTYFSNYAYTKAQAERLVLQANRPDFQTGCLRPTAVYGNSSDLILGSFAVRMQTATWTQKTLCGCVHAENVSLAHLQYEHAMLSSPPPSPSSSGSSTHNLPGGRSFLITDPGPPVAYEDTHMLLQTLTPRFKVVSLTPIIVLLAAYFIEAYCLLPLYWPALSTFMPTIPPLVRMLQPAALFSVNVNQLPVLQDATKRVEDGGIGYRGPYGTLEGMVTEIMQLNDEMGRPAVDTALE